MVLTLWHFLKFQCGGCSATCYKKSKRHFKIRMCKNFRVSTLTEKRVKDDDDSAIKEHLLFCSLHLLLCILHHAPDFEDF